MATDPSQPRPKRFPPPEFPLRKAALFARTPPAIFPVILGSLGLALAFRRGLLALEMPLAVADILAGIVLALWAFAAFAYLAKLARRPSVIFDDLKILPGRVGLAAGTAGMLATAALLEPFAPAVARGVLFVGLGAHGILAVLGMIALNRLPAEARMVNPGWHLSFVGFIIGGLSAVPLGLEGLARVLFWGTLPVAAVIWAVSLWQMQHRLPPAPLRPMLAIHLAPASLFAIVGASLGLDMMAGPMALLASVMLLALVLRLSWLVEGGFSAFWGSFTFPLAAVASAFLAVGDFGIWTGLAVLAMAAVLTPWILWRILRMWATGALAEKSNAALA